MRISAEIRLSQMGERRADTERAAAHNELQHTTLSVGCAIVRLTYDDPGERSLSGASIGQGA
jgi:hypothetical protein